LVWVAAAFAAGIYIAALAPILGVFAFSTLCLAGVLFAAFQSRLPSRNVPAVLLCAFSVGGLLWNARHGGPPGDPLSRYVVQQDDRKLWALEGRVRLADLEETDPESYSFLLDVDEIREKSTTEPIRGTVAVRWNIPDALVFADERVRVTGRLTPRLSAVNFGASSYEDYMRGQGVHSALQTTGPNAVERLEPGRSTSLRYWASRMRAYQMQRLTEAVPQSALPFLYAVWLGYRTTIAQDEYEAYINSGTAHILSVSGIHMAMVFVTASFLVRLVTRRVRVRALIVMGAVVLFTLMSGLRPSALRSAIMIIVYLLAEIFEREPDSLTALSLSALLLLGWNPDTLFDVGFLLSFLSVASILFFAKPVAAFLGAISGACRRFLGSTLFPRLMPWLLALRNTVAVSLAVQILPTPFAIYTFHVFPLGAVAANLLVIPASTLALWLCFLTSVATLVSRDAALLFGHALEPVVGFIRVIVEGMGTSGMTHRVLTSPTTFSVLCYYACVVSCVGIAKSERRRPWVLAAIACAVFAIAGWRPLVSPATVDFLDVGHGDSTFVRSPEGATLLVDGADRTPQVDMGRRIVAPFLWSSHVRRLDYVALTHPDRDHIGGLLFVVEKFPVGTVLLGPTETDRPLEQELLAVCARKGIPVKRVHAGTALDLGGMTLTVLHPPPGWTAAQDVNDQSLVLRLEWNGISILLPGDIEAAAEAAVSETPCHANVLKAPHHGSRTSSSTRFITTVDPECCIISTGGSSGREHVDETILARYRDYDIPVWCTDRFGGIRLRRKHDKVLLESARNQRGYPCPSAEYPEIRAR
jgi:competence protein ComEC